MKIASLVAAAVAAALSPAVPAHAAGPVAATPVKWVLPSTDVVTDVLGVGTKAWVAAGDRVLIVSPTSGAADAPVLGLPGAKALTLAPDGQSVYVSTDTKIVQLDTSGAVLGSWTSQACPGTSAIAGGSLFYVYGCGAQPTGIARLDLSTHEDRPELNGAAVGVTGGGATLVVLWSTDGEMTSYTVDGDGELIPTADGYAGATTGAALSPDGTELLTTFRGLGYALTRFDAETLEETGSYGLEPDPVAVAWSPDGSRFAGVGKAASAASPLQVFDAQSGNLVTRAASAGTTSYRSLAPEASWSTDGRFVYSLAQESASAAPYLVVTPVAGQAPGPVTVRVTPASAYGKNMTVTVRAPSRAGARVHVTVTQNDTATRRMLRLDAKGTATWSLPATASGTVSATTFIDTVHLAGYGSARFDTPARVTATLGAKKGRPRLHVQVLPKHAATVTVALQRRTGSSWKTVQKSVLRTEDDGRVSVILRKAMKKGTYRFAVRADDDEVTGPSPTVLVTWPPLRCGGHCAPKSR
ncbi:hypothetical protein [Actinoplanes sp. NPDC051859]|uniref:hypothetical protein n=1 Tax=Actinoplanes sp. NPDC051859 TaxID=3363909 RepID=UPI0037AEA131